MNNIKGTAEVIFGDGKICMSPAAYQYDGGIIYGMFLSELSSNYKIGETIKDINEGRYSKAPVKLFFKNKESIDVLIEQLQSMKKCAELELNG